MDDPLLQVLTQLLDAATIVARERDALTTTLASLHADVRHLHDEVARLRGQLARQIVASPTVSCLSYPSLTSEIREHVDTACAAYHLGRKVQTLRAWACYENGPIRPVRIHGRLAWAVADLRGLASQSSPSNQRSQI